MQRKVAEVSQGLTRIIRDWEGVEAVLLGEVAEIRVLDPYFSISLDVYHRGDPPPPEERWRLFGDPTAFQSAPVSPEDRFLLQDLPVYIHYQEASRFDLLLDRIGEHLWVFRDTGTVDFYRLQHGQVLFRKSSWLEEIQERLENLPDHFWKTIRDASRCRLEVCLNNLNAAVYRNDRLYTLLASAAFIRSLCSFLFAVNRRFEPLGRMLHEKVRELPIKPDEFDSRFDSFLREDPELTPDRKREIATLLVKCLLPLA